jgi:hypothetical protein
MNDRNTLKGATMLTLKPPRLLTLLLLGAIALTACAGQPEPPPAAVVQPRPASATSAPIIAPTSASSSKPTAPAPTVPSSSTAVVAAPTSAPNPTADPITGAPGLARGALTRRPFMVMIDNHPDAYPQIGLDHAAVVFEALAEFGVTRFMALYAPGITPDAPQIGPVRSTRLYFAQWAIGFRPLYVHAGGSPQGLALVESTDQLINLDALRRDGEAYFARSSDREAPHNLYISSADVERAAADRGVSDFAHPEVGFLFKTDAPEAQRPVSEQLNYFFIYKEDNAGWDYDPKTNGYLRLRRDDPARDAATGKQLWTKNVVVIEVAEAKIAGDEKGRIEQDVIGTGPARVFMDGVERAATWSKTDAAAPLRFYDASGDEVKLNAGPVWIAALPSLDHLTVE